MMRDYIKIYETCRLVRGASRSAIFDLDNHKYILISNELHDILLRCNNHKESDLYNSYSGVELKILKNNIEELKKTNILFNCSVKDIASFTELDVTFKNPSIITNAIIYINENVHYLAKIIQELDLLLCKDILCIQSNYNISILQTLQNLIVDSNIRSIVLYTPDDLKIKQKKLINFLENNPRIKRIYIYSAPNNELIFENTFQKQKMAYLKMDASYCHREDIIGDDFNVNIDLFTESINQNSCLNRKLSIDKEGNIKNCPELPDSFGNIKNNSLLEILNFDNFKKFWDITKDSIDECKECEYRYVCMDCRCHIRDKNNIYSKQTNCYYNPYTSCWEIPK